MYSKVETRDDEDDRGVGRRAEVPEAERNDAGSQNPRQGDQGRVATPWMNRHSRSAARGAPRYDRLWRTPMPGKCDRHDDKESEDG